MRAEALLRRSGRLGRLRRHAQADSQPPSDSDDDDEDFDLAEVSASDSVQDMEDDATKGGSGDAGTGVDDEVPGAPNVIGEGV